MSRHHTLAVAFCLAMSLAGCTNNTSTSCAQSPGRMPPIHPGALAPVMCWLSDTAYPIVTELNLDAIRRNRNQFDMEHVVVNGNDVHINIKKGNERRGFLGYRVICSEGNTITLELYDNGGGTLTTHTLIECTLIRRKICVNGEIQSPQILRIDRVTNENGEWSGDVSKVAGYFNQKA